MEGRGGGLGNKEPNTKMISKEVELDHRGTVSGWVCMCMEVARSVLGL